MRKNGKLEPATWPEAFQATAAKLKGLPGSKIAAIAGDLADAESMLALKDLMFALDSPNLDCRQDGAKLGTLRASYLFNTTIAGIDNADALLLIGTNPRWEAPVINARIRKRWLKGKFPIAAIGAKLDLGYRHQHLGTDLTVLQAIADGTHPFAATLKDAKHPMLILGQGALTRPDGEAVLALARQVAESTGMAIEGWNGFNVLHTAAARVGGLDLGFVPGLGGGNVAEILDRAKIGDIAAVYLLGADEIDTAGLGSAFVIYQGHNGDAGAHRADVILPGAAYTEKSGTYVNTEGRAQRTQMAVFPPGEAREDWKILRALSEVLGVPLKYDSLAELRDKLTDVNEVFGMEDQIAANLWDEFGVEGPVSAEPLRLPIANYYMTDPISRASKTMAECTVAFVSGAQRRTGTHG